VNAWRAASSSAAPSRSGSCPSAATAPPRVSRAVSATRGGTLAGTASAT
jgi:hypothetical protein